MVKDIKNKYINFILGIVYGVVFPMGLILLMILFNAMITDNQQTIIDNQNLIYNQNCDIYNKFSLARFELPNDEWYVDRICFLARDFQGVTDCRRARELLEMNITVKHWLWNETSGEAIRLN